MTNGHQLARAAGHRRTIARLAAAAVLSSGAMAELDAQQYECRLRVPPPKSATTYRYRDTHCEGMYVAEQSAPLDVQVVSLVRGGLRYDLGGDSILHVRAPLLPPTVNTGSVILQGRTRETNLAWALDARIETGGQFTWHLTKVIKPEQLASDVVGLFAETRRPPLGEPLYVPVSVTRSPGEAGAPEDSLELVIRVPGAAAVRWAFVERDDCPTGPDDRCHEAKRLNADGYFSLAIPPGRAGEVGLAIHWRPRGKREFADVPQYLRLYRW